MTPASTVPVRTGLIGAGIGRSFSPAPHETEAAAHGVDLTYSLFDTDLDSRPLAELLSARGSRTMIGAP